MTMRMNLHTVTSGRARPAALLLAVLALLAGCRRQPAGAAPDGGGVTVTAAELEAVDAALVEQLVPADADGPRRLLGARERDMARHVLALSKRRDQVVRERTLGEPEARTLHQRMTEAREAYQQHVAAMPEVARLDQQLALCRRQLQEMRELAMRQNAENPHATNTTTVPQSLPGSN